MAGGAHRVTVLPDDALLVEAVSAWAGAAVPVRRWAWPHGESLVLRLQTPRGDVVAKWVNREGMFTRERHAMLHYTPALGDGAPRLLHADPDRSVLVLTVVPGDLVEGCPAEHLPGVHRQAGALIGALHRSAPPALDERWGAHLLDSFDGWAARAAGIVAAADLDRVRVRLATVAHVGPVALVAAHRDNSPRNWMIADGRVRLIDFGHCRPAPWVVDLHRMEQGVWAGRPALRAAFLDGYGVEPTEHDLAVLAAHDTLSAVSTIAWATEHGDAAFAEQGRAALARVLDG